MSIQKCTFGYHRANDSGLDTFASGVANGVYSNATIFPAPSITEAVFTVAKDDFSVAAADYATYGFTKKTAYLTAKKTLMDNLDSLAAYVDSIALGDPSMIDLAGYVPSAATPQKNLPIEKIPFFTYYRTAVTGELGIEIPAIRDRGDVNYLCVCCEGAPLTNPYLVNGQIKVSPTDSHVLQDSNKSRRKLFTGLKPGIVYNFYVYAANTAGVSPLSDVLVVMAV